MNNRKIVFAAAALAIALTSFAYFSHHHAPNPAVDGLSPLAVGQPQTFSPMSSSIAVKLENGARVRSKDLEIDVTPEDLRRRFYSATDFQPLVRDSAYLALNKNNGRAAWLIAESLKMCADAIARARKDPDFEQNFDLEY